MALNKHLIERFFQRYYKELTPEIIIDLVRQAKKKPGRKDPKKPWLEHITVYYDGEPIRMVWHRKTCTVHTFLAEWMTDFSK